jgi:hypothetical protein
MTFRRTLALFPLLLTLPTCSSDDEPSEGSSCPSAASRFPTGDVTGHSDVFGAKAAGQARAGRVTDAAQIVQPAHGRQRVNVGDYVIANDKVAFYIEDKGLSDGYARFGGELLAVDRVGDDGKPLGTSYYIETLLALSIQMIDPESVSVMNDGSDGKAAVVRASGLLTAIPFMDQTLGVLFPNRYEMQGVLDYVLEPGSEKLSIRIGVINPTREVLDFAADEMHGFFQVSRNQLATLETGFGKPSGKLAMAGWINDGTSFGWRPAGGEKLHYNAEISGFVYMVGPGFQAEACGTTMVDHIEVIAGGPEWDGLREAQRRVDGEPAWRAVTGTVKEATGEPVAGAFVHLLATDGTYVSRVKTDEAGAFSIHAEPGKAGQLVAQRRGYPPSPPSDLAVDATSADVTLAANGKLHVTVKDLATDEALPVRIQVIPVTPPAGTPDAYGVLDEANGRLHQEFALSGEATLPVPPGDHRVIVSRGYEWELFDQTLTVAEGATLEVPVTLERSVDSTGWMCADFHIHSWFSADSDDAVDSKVTSAIADGLEIPVSSEHEWVIDFQPIVEKLGMTKWARGMPSEELTTFTWGHFGVVPLYPKPEKVNNGAIEWIGRKPPEMFDDVQSQPEDPVFIINHPSGGGFGAYFSASNYDNKTGSGKNAELWSDNFDALEVFNDSDLEENRDESLEDWFGLLNVGKTVWAVGSSDSHHIRSSPVGYPRTCLFFGHDDPTQLTPETLRDVLSAGTATISGGLLMTVEGPGGEKPGSTITGASGSSSFTVTVRAPSWITATTLEVFVNGETAGIEDLQPFGTGTGKTFVNQVTVTLDATKPRNWVVFHAKGDSDLGPLHPGRNAFAVSNPIFFD